MIPTSAPVFDPILIEQYQTSSAWTEVSEPDTGNWLQEAIMRTLGFQHLPRDWDSYGSGPVTFEAVRTSVHLLYMGWRYSAVERPPEIVPMSGGGLHLVWYSDDRQVEMDVHPDGVVTSLKLEADEPVGDDESLRVTREEVEAVLSWL